MIVDNVNSIQYDWYSNSIFVTIKHVKELMLDYVIHYRFVALNVI